MRDYSNDFALTPGQVWLNAASEGPIPKAAVQALNEAVVWKSSPHLLTIPKFQHVPIELKNVIAELIHVPSDEVILGNSATYGMHILANGLSLVQGDEVVLMQNDFPTDILPWLHLKNKDIVVRQVKGVGEVLAVDEIAALINNKTKVVCLPYIHTFSGHALDIVAIGRLCRAHGILFVVNMSQAIGAFEVNMADLPIDAIVCAGYKWLLGPYGTGFCWMRKSVREQLNYSQAYWISLMDERSLGSTEEIFLSEDRSARKYDVFATANFFNYVPWISSIKYFLGIGMGEVARHNQHLVRMIIDGLDVRFTCVSPVSEQARTNLMVFSHKNQAENIKVFEYLKGCGLHLALWKGKMRISPHIYNTEKDIVEFLGALNAYGG